MKAYKFRLEKLLGVKEIKLKQRQKEHADAAQARLDAEKQLEDKKKEAGTFAKNVFGDSRINAGQLNQQYDYYYQLLAEADKLEKSVRRCAVDEECFRQSVENAYQEQKALQKLRERELEEHLRQEASEAQKTLDELAIISAR